MGRALQIEPETFPLPAQWLGFAGLVPQILLVRFAIAGPASFGPVAGGIALAYSGTILSFIGGAWWGIASRTQTDVHWSIWIAAVIPSLIGFAAIGASGIGLPRGQCLLLTGALLIGTLGIDYKLAAGGISPPGWLSLRIPLSLGLGGLTILMAIFS